MSTSWRRRLPRIGRVPRLCAAGLCLLLALSSALGGRHGAAAPATRTTAVVVAAADLPAGHALAARDLSLVRLPPGAAPAGAAIDRRALLGRRLAAPVSRHEPITAVRLVGRDLLRGLVAGTVAAGLDVDDPHLADLVHPGDLVDVLAAPRPADLGAAGPAAAPRQVVTVARGARVLAVLPAADGAGTELYLGLDRSTALRVVRDRPTQVFTVIAAPP